MVDLKDKLKIKADNQPQIQVRKTTPIKLKDKNGKGGIRVDWPSPLVPFVPTGVILQKVFGENNTVVLNFIKPKNYVENQPKK
jgi:hypothetical protein